MTLSEALHHILHITLRWVRREKPQDRFFESPNSISTPLGYIPSRRRLNVNASLQDGIETARKREYATRKCKRHVT